ncbi:hypothetical protein HMPREF0742_01379 [Rothia aeria F0184]|uniref:Uncharacterized protein n=1 Tax=Rothia aeria F0184 TaxID=888019 RepID=U7V368_9MICC|nr:hypothetical protein HMPREF0742_01379 [Rothia aeria F0184]
MAGSGDRPSTRTGHCRQQYAGCAFIFICIADSFSSLATLGMNWLFLRYLEGTATCR